MHGYQGATLRNIAREVEIKPSSVYYFFDNKEKLFSEAFEQLLTDHFEEMKRIIESTRGQPIEEILNSLIQGSVDYHTTNPQDTNAYITLITSPPPEILEYLQGHIQIFDSWLKDTLTGLIRRDRHELGKEESARLVRQFVILMDGVFWEMNLYNADELKKQIRETQYIMRVLLRGEQA